MTMMWEWHPTTLTPRVRVHKYRQHWGYTCDHCFPDSVRVSVLGLPWRYLDAWSAAVYHVRDRH